MAKAKTKTKNFTVSGSIEVPIGFCIPVEAVNAKEAEKKVREMLLTKKAYSFHDFDGNRMDFEDGDIDVFDIAKET